MQKKEIEMYLAQLGQELQVLEVQRPVRILLIGGAFMLIQVKNRQTTDDIDILLKDGEDAIPVLSQTFKAAIRAVAARNSLKGNWLNDIMSDFLRDAGNVPAGKLWRKYGKLEVFLPPKQYILALKLLAGRPKDVSDIQVLCQQLKIRTHEQAQMLVDRYIPNKQLQKLNRLDETLNDFFLQP